MSCIATCRYPDSEGTVGRNFLCKALSEFAVAAAASCEKAGWPPSEALRSHQQILQAFPEDLEMRAFTPLLQIQEDLDYSRVLDQQARQLDPRKPLAVAPCFASHFVLLLVTSVRKSPIAPGST